MGAIVQYRTVFISVFKIPSAVQPPMFVYVCLRSSK